MTGAIALLTVVVAGAGAFALALVMAERKGRSQERADQAANERERLHDAVEADAGARERIARGGLLEDDGHRRD